MLLPLALVITFWSLSALSQNCDPVDFGHGTVVCKCNSTYCDFYPDPDPPSSGKYIWYVTDKAGKRLEKTDGDIASVGGNNYVTVTINDTIEYQTIIGFGGAFTDSAGINIKNLSPSAQDNLIRSYFSSNGIKYNLARVPIAGCDFSTRGYSYDDYDGDTILAHFSLTVEDAEYKIPLMQQALNLNPELRFVSAAWTAPPWMKNVKKFSAISHLEEKYYQVYANYLVKFLEEYQKNGLEIWAISTGNEPYTSLNPFSPINSMYWSPSNVAKWIANNLGPSIQNSASNGTSILILDDQRAYIPSYINSVKSANTAALDYVKGIAIHWYMDDFILASMLDSTHDKYPDKFILMTEACIGFYPWDSPKVILGSWSRAESQITKMFQNFNHYVVGWIDWNLALDPDGGPNWVNNKVDSPIIVEAATNTFFKQPYYYAMGHFSKFIPRNSVRIQAKKTDDEVLTLAFKKDDQKMVLLYNRGGNAKNVSVVDGNAYMNIELPEYSLHTILYKK